MLVGGMTEAVAKYYLTDCDQAEQIKYQASRGGEVLYTDVMGLDRKTTAEEVEEIARETLKRNSGARGLRSVLEKLLIPVMYDVSSRDGVKAVTFDLEGVRTGIPQVS